MANRFSAAAAGAWDPPTAYVYPAAYDQITVLKGPQTVLYGPGNSAGTVLFERSAKTRTGGCESRGFADGGKLRPQ